jgi:pimeloyl-ACP methyl ester carboxylesterase
MAAGYAEVNGARLYYEVAGEGHPLVLIHAAIADSRMWNSQFAEFAKRYRVVRYDLRGFGKSAMVDGQYSDRDDLLGLLDFLGMDKAYLLGCSMGGSTAFDFTLEHPQMLDALIMVASGLRGIEFTGDPPALEEELVAAFKAGDIAKSAELEARIFLAGEGRTLDQIDPALRTLLIDMDTIALGNEKRRNEHTMPPPEPPAFTRVGEIHIPLLYIYGDRDDAIFARVAEMLAREIPGAQVAMMPDTAHLPNMEQPTEFNRIVKDFLGKI